MGLPVLLAMKKAQGCSDARGLRSCREDLIICLLSNPPTHIKIHIGSTEYNLMEFLLMCPTKTSCRQKLLLYIGTFFLLEHNRMLVNVVHIHGD